MNARIIAFFVRKLFNEATMSGQGEYLTPPQDSPTLRDLLDKNGQKIPEILASIANSGLSEQEKAQYGVGHPVMELAEAAAYIMNDREPDRDGVESYLFGYMSAARVLGRVGVRATIEDLNPVDLVGVCIWNLDWGECHSKIEQIVREYRVKSACYTYVSSALFRELVADKAPRPVVAGLGWYTCLAVTDNAIQSHAAEWPQVTGVGIVPDADMIAAGLRDLEEFLARHGGEAS